MKISEETQKSVEDLLRAEFAKVNSGEDGRIRSISELEERVGNIGGSLTALLMERLSREQEQKSAPQKKTV